MFLAGITLPTWYWAPRQTFDNGTSAHGTQIGYFPNGPHGHTGYGLYLDTLPKALLAAAICLVLFLVRRAGPARANNPLDRAGTGRKDNIIQRPATISAPTTRICIAAHTGAVPNLRSA